MTETRKDLANLKCVPCRGGIPPLIDLKIKQMLPAVPGWERIKEDGVDKIRRKYKFKNFVEAMEFTNGVAEIAEEQGHHPDIYIQWNIVELTLWTHAIKGLHENDFILAAKIDEMKEQLE
ncbi:MAG: 4a-hydroxytetrahydrobiopterin dehydratase [Thermoplasmata archaeon M9B2D]|nr:MAG: 4a-hydroxytetrahydrobiopterin dehydratase [Thermoplasmata archaeon M9B2D]